MSRSSNDSSWGRRKSMFALSLTQINDDPAVSKPRILKKRRPSILTDAAHIDHPDLPRDNYDLRSAPPALSESPKSRPSLSMRGSLRRRPSVFGSLRGSMRTSSDVSEALGEPLSATPSMASSNALTDGSHDTTPMNHVVLHRGEVQTSSGLLRKRREYVVLTETSIHRFKSQGKASEVFASIRNPAQKHGQSASMSSASSHGDLSSLGESSGERDGRIALRQIVAVKNLEDGKPSYAIEITHLDEECYNQASAMTLQFTNLEERDIWLGHVRAAVNVARLKNESYVSPSNLEHVARTIERAHDYDPANCAIFKVAKRLSSKTTTGRSSSDDLSKVSSTVCFLAIGVHMVHLVQVVKSASRTSSPSLAPNASLASFGILTLGSVKVSSEDDSIELVFRQPMKSSKTLYLASSASYEIATRLHFAENYLRPERGLGLYRFQVPKEVEASLAPAVSSDTEEHCCLVRTLSAFCVAYGVNPARIRYSINYDCEDAPGFEVLPPADPQRPDYGPLDLLAIMRALRYNETFGSISFAGIQLDCLNGLHDDLGYEQVCSRTKRGTPIKLTPEELVRSCLLVQEIRALAACSKKLRRMDFSNAITSEPPVPTTILEDEATKTKDLGCGIVEALFPLCRHQTTNVDWVCLNGILLSDTDLDYLVGAAVDRSCHFRAIELNRCGLTDRTLGLVLDALRAQDNTLESVQIAGNPSRISPTTFDSQLGMFGFIRKLDLSWITRTAGPEPLLTAETLLMWRLQELRLSGTPLNAASIDAICTYLAHPQSESLHELAIDRAYVSGSDIAKLLASMVRQPGQIRNLHFDISQDHITKDIDKVAQAFASGMAPTHLTMRAIEYREESSFRKVLSAIAVNKSIQFLDMAQTALPGDAGDDTCRLLERLLAENDTLLALDLSGEDSRLATSKFGPGLNDALAGLKHNTTMQRFHIEKQKLGLQGSSTLADVLKVNSTLRELHCDNNEIPLQGLTDLVNELVDNTTLLYLPEMGDGRAAAFKAAEATMKAMADFDAPPVKLPTQGSSMGMQRKLTNAKRNLARTASAYTPSLQALQQAHRSSSTPETRPSSSLTLTLPAPKARKTVQQPNGSVPVSFTVQDIQNTKTLLNEQWDRQCARLGQYLQRNYCLLHELPLDPGTDTDRFERPESVGSIGQVLERVKFDTTPRVEKPLYFDSPLDDTDITGGGGSGAGLGSSTSGSDLDEDPPPPATPEESKLLVLDDKSQPISFKQFLLDSGSDDAAADDLHDDTTAAAAAMKGIGRIAISNYLDESDEPRTPTQQAFATG